MELAESIRTVGLLQAIGVVRVGDRYRIVFGHRRYLACRYLARVEIDAQVLEQSEALEFEASAAENVVRRDLNPVEEARAIRHMVDARGKSVREVAAALGRSESWVRMRLEVLLWPDELVALVAQGELSVSVAREVVLVEDDRVRAHYLRCALESGCTASQMRQWRSEWELSRSLGVGFDEAAASGEAPPLPIVPQVVCQMCLGAHPVTAVQFLKFCPSCVIALDQARRGDGGDAPA
jgi:ParB/RepB/Spo0J family partition protein